jgi:hydrogenase maturation factor
MTILRAGKVPPQVLKKCVFPFLGASDSSVLHGPGIGRDAALVQVGQKVAVASTDPITGAEKNIGAYALHICANDVATFGVKPRWFLVTILLPEGSDSELLHTIMQSMDEAAKELDVAIIGGHSETTSTTTRPIVVGFMLGISEKGEYVTSTSGEKGNVLILTKGVAIEGTAILASERVEELRKRLDPQLLQRAQQFISKLSVVPEALKAMSTGAVTAMHDPTEGGIANGLHELADASNLGFIVHRDALTIHEETRAICEIFEINPLELIASGAMLIAVKKESATQVLTGLQEAKIQASVIGKLVAAPQTRVIVESDGSQVPLPQPVTDALWDALTTSL